MKSKLIAIGMCTILTTLSSGCTREASRIYTVCRQTETEMYVYNMDDGFFVWKGGKLFPCTLPDLQKTPCLTLVFDDSIEYTLEPEIPSVYTGTKDDALHYATKLLKEDSGVYKLLNVDWKSFEMLVSTDQYTVRIYYTTDNKVRIYAQDEEGVTITPPYLEDL